MVSTAAGGSSGAGGHGTAGKAGTGGASAGGSTSTGGSGGKATGGSGTAGGGHGGTSNAGQGGTSSAGQGGTSPAGEGGTAGSAQGGSPAEGGAAGSAGAGAQAGTTSAGEGGSAGVGQGGATSTGGLGGEAGSASTGEGGTAGASVGGSNTGGTGTAGSGTAGAGGVACGAGTVDQNGTCVIAPPAAVTQARVTFFLVDYELAKPAVVNSPITVKFGITAQSANNATPATTSTDLFFYFQEAVPADPLNPMHCSANSLAFNLVGDGSERLGQVDLLPSDECNALVGAGGDLVAVGIDFDFGQKNPNIDYPPVVFSKALQTDTLNQLCRAGGDKTTPTGVGCAAEITLMPQPQADGAPGLDVSIDAVTPDSSIITLWPTQQDPDVPNGMTETPEPSLTVVTTISVAGKDPFLRKVDLANLPPQLLDDPTAQEDFTFGMTPQQLDALNALPSPATLTYEIAPTEGTDTKNFMQLSMDDPTNPNAGVHVNSISIADIDGGEATNLTHDLYIEGAVATQVTGAWAAYDEYNIRVCLKVSFPEVGDEGDPSEDDADNAPASEPDTAANDCKIFKVKLVKALPPAGPANSFAFEMTWAKSVGSADTVQLAGNLTTSNQLNLNGATTNTEGKISLTSKLLGSLDVVRAYGKAGALTTQANSYIDTGVDAFGTNIWGYQTTGSSATYTNAFSAAKSFSFPVFKYGFGPVSVGVTVGFGGTIGVTPTFTIAAQTGGNAAIPSLVNATSNGTLSANFTPNIGLTGSAEGGIDLGLARAGVQANLQIVNVAAPVVATLNWGVTGQDDMMNVTQITALGSTTWNLNIDWCNLDVNVVGKIGIGWFSKSFNVNVWQIKNPTETVNLLNRTQADPLVLQ